MKIIDQANLGVWLPLLLSLCGCSEYTFKNYSAYGSLQRQGAAQFDTLDTKAAILSFAQFTAIWNNPADPLIALHVSAYEDIISGLQTLCSDHPGACTVEVVNAMSNVSAQLVKIKRHAKIEADWGGEATSIEGLGLQPEK